MKTYSILLVVIIMFAAACNRGNKALEKPEIVFRSFSHETVRSGDLKDTLLINLRYTMATKSLGSETDPSSFILKDSRDPGSELKFSFPNEIYGNVPDPTQNNISGTVTLRLSAGLFFVLRPDRPEGDTLQYEILLRDKDEVESAPVTSGNIFIIP